MLKNYLKIAWRHLKKNKGYALLNMAGLALGMACAILILLWINDEWQYDRFHKNRDWLYRLYENQHYDGQTFTFTAMPGPFAAAARAELPEIQYITRADFTTRSLFTLGEKSIYEQGMHVDPDFLKMFSFKLLKGNAATLLTDPSSIVITDVMAKQFFGNDNPLGKTLKVDNSKLYTVNAVIEEPPTNSSIQFAWLAPFSAIENENPWLKVWGNNGIQTYVQLKKGINPEQVNKKLYSFIQHKDTTAVARPFLVSIKDLRLRSNFKDGKYAGGRIEYVRLFAIIALLIIVIACINFMNLATARSEQRAREVGMRKVMGAGKGLLIRQFFGESIVMCIAAMLMALLIVFLCLPAFNQLVEKKLSFNLTNPVIWAGMPLLTLLCGVLAGSYPSLYLSSFNPATVFRSTKAIKGSVITYIRKGLVVTQFAVSIILIICTIIIYRQIQHTKNRNLGYSKDNVLYTSVLNMKDHLPAVRNDLLATGVVEDAGVSVSKALAVRSSSGGFKWAGKQTDKDVLIGIETVDAHYLPTMHMTLVAGRNFYPDSKADSNSIIINEAFARVMHKKNPVGDLIRWNDDTYQVVGVVKDYVYNDMYKEPAPLTLFCGTDEISNLLIRLKDNKHIPAALASIETVIKKYNPAYPFEYKFVDEDFNTLFKSEMLIGKLSRLFALLTILISCLGLFGLAAYTAERRTREIGIRKVLGATLGSVITLLSKDFLKLVLLAALVAFPLAWWFMHRWLQDYAYRINIEWWVFAVAGTLAVVIALLTVSVQALKAALTNPVKSLRSE